MSTQSAELPQLNRFDAALDAHDLGPLRRERVTTLQINVGKLCNQACLHCHVDAGPKRTEIMPREVAERLLWLLDRSPSVETVDITGGAPELNANFRDLVVGARERGRHVIDRCNLTVLLEPGQQDLVDFLAEHEVEVIASLPCYSAENVNQQRGKGVFGKSIRALQALNALGYGKPDSGLELNLVYNPLGPSLPPPQASLEARYKEELADNFGIVFNRLFTLTNLPISRFLHMLRREGQLEAYQELLANSFNPATVDGLMCRHQISVGWRGRLYDCDFNQMLELGLPEAEPHADTIWDIDSFEVLAEREITTRDHCFGCTAGAGSSCGGAIES